MSGRVGSRSGRQMESRNRRVLMLTGQGQGTIRATAFPGSSAGHLVAEEESHSGSNHFCSNLSLLARGRSVL